MALPSRRHSKNALIPLTILVSVIKARVIQRVARGAKLICNVKSFSIMLDLVVTADSSRVGVAQQWILRLDTQSTHLSTQKLSPIICLIACLHQTRLETEFAQQVKSLPQLVHKKIVIKLVLPRAHGASIMYTELIRSARSLRMTAS